MIWKVAFLAVLVSSPAFADSTIEGRVTVVRDVDTIVVSGTRHFFETSPQIARVGQIFHPRDRRLRAQRRPGVRITLTRKLERRIIAQIIRVVAVLITRGDHRIRNRMMSSRLCCTLPGSRGSVRQDDRSPAKLNRRSISRRSVRPASELISAPSK